MDKAQLEQYLNTAKETINKIFADINISMPDLSQIDTNAGIIILIALFLAWGAFKLGVKVGKTSLDYDHKLSILARIAKVFYEVQGSFNSMQNASPEDISEVELKTQATQLKKLAAVLRKDIAMWSMTAPTNYLDHIQKLISQIEKSAENLSKTKITNKMNESKIKGLVKKQHNPVLSTYESMVIAMRKDIRSDGTSKIIKTIIRG